MINQSMHTGKNDLRNEKKESQIARSITKLATSLKENYNLVSLWHRPEI